jgi:uncharacterized protein YoxC
MLIFASVTAAAVAVVVFAVFVVAWLQARSRVQAETSKRVKVHEDVLPMAANPLFKPAAKTGT